MMAAERDIARLESSIRELERRVRRLEEAIYGDGSDAGLMQRIAKLEGKIESLVTRIGSLEKNISFNTYLTAGTFLSIIVAILALIMRGG